MALAVVAALRYDWDCQVVLRWGGPLTAEFAATGARVRNEPLRRVRAAARRYRPSRRLATALELAAAAVTIVAVRPDVVWANTILSSCYLRPARWLRRPIILLAHEDRDWMAQVLARDARTKAAPVRLVGCAPTVCRDLAQVFGRPPEEVACLPSVPDGRKVVARAGHTPTAGFPPGLLVGACGAANSGKGVDLWLEIAEQVSALASDIAPRFVWIGDDPPPHFASWAARTGLADRVTFTGTLQNPYPHLARLDVFTLPSRADAFPLVVLEAMHLARPVVAFAVGGVADQLGSTGRLVPPLDVEGASAAVVDLLRDDRLRAEMGAAESARARKEFPHGQWVAQVRDLVESQRR